MNMPAITKRLRNSHRLFEKAMKGSLSAVEAADELGNRLYYVYFLHNSGRLHGLKFGAFGLRFDPKEVRRFIKARTAKREARQHA